MSNDTCLHGGATNPPEWLVIYTDDEDPSGGEDLRAAEYVVPLLWLALFSEGDVGQAVDIDDDTFVFLQVDRTAALVRLDQRSDQLCALLPGIRPALARWRQTLAALRHPRLSVDLCELLGMDEAVEDDLRAALSWFESASPEGLAGLMRMLSATYDPAARALQIDQSASLEDVLIGFER